jgi:hypothetical protein
MYYTRFHKNIFNDIWRGGAPKLNKGKAGNSYDLEKYLAFCNKHKNGVVYKKENKSNDLIFADRPFKKNVSYIISSTNETRMILMLNEFASIIDYLYKNDLILIIEKNTDCPPLFLEDEKPFDEALKVVKPYIGKEIVVREGFKKFKKFNYRTHEELVRLLIALLVPTVTIFITVGKALFDHFLSNSDNSIILSIIHGTI